MKSVVQIVGLVAINWLVIADQSEHGIFDPGCFKLAELHSNAVDFPKSGRPVRLHEIPMPKHSAKPDWNAPETVQVDYESGAYYGSTKAIGRLFRSIDLPIDSERQSKPQRKSRGYPRMKNFDELEAAFTNLNLTNIRGGMFSVRAEDFLDIDAPRDVDKDQIRFIARLYHTTPQSSERFVCPT
jgi:RNA-dependent RNA polymerase